MVACSRMVKKRQTPPKMSHWHPFMRGLAPGLNCAASCVILRLVEVPTANCPEAVTAIPVVLPVVVVERQSILMVCVLRE